MEGVTLQCVFGQDQEAVIARLGCVFLPKFQLPTRDPRAPPRINVAHQVRHSLIDLEAADGSHKGLHGVGTQNKIHTWVVQ